MDVNGTHFHQLLGAADWARCTVDAGIVTGDETTLKPLLLRLPPASAGSDPAQLRRGAGRDRYGNWYWIDASSSKIFVQSSGTGTVSDFWPVPIVVEAPRDDAFGPVDPPAPAQARSFGGLAVTEDHYLIVGTLDQPGLLAFDLHAGGQPRQLRWPASIPFQPFDLAPAPGGGVWVLDRVNKRYWALDRHLGVIQAAGAPPPPDDFSPASGVPDDLRPSPVGFPPGLDLATAAVPIGATDPVAIESLPDGTVLILDRQGPESVHRYRLAQLLSTVVLDLSAVLAAPPAPGEQLFGADLAFVANQLFVPAGDGSQAFCFDAVWENADLALTVATPFLPMRLFGGRGLVAADQYAWYDVGDKAWVPLIEQKRPRFVGEGTIDTPALDGNDPGCVWHRLFIDGCVPDSAAVEVWSRTADDAADLERAPWAPEPAPRRRASGSELPLISGDVFELLFQRARGRYLQVRLQLSGDGRTSPRLHALRIWYPRFSYLERYLPAVYRDDAESASFLDRFLANLEGLFTSIEDKMAVAQLLLDARTAPAEALDWLASWFGVALDPAWTESRRRLFLRHAMDFFQMRGTVRGLTTALRLVIDDCADDELFQAADSTVPQSIRLLEWFRKRETPALELGDPSDGIREIAQGSWSPSQGGAALLQLYQAALATAGLGAAASFPVVAPTDGSAAVWTAFATGVLGFVPAAGARTQQAYRDFLARRYRRIAAFNTVYGTGHAGFDSIALPASLPPDGQPLQDWNQFFGLALAILGLAHRFTVLLPVPAREAFAVTLHQARKDLATRIIELEKPAHTLFDVKFYWAMFRVGEARLGLDTLLDVGSRAPELMPPMVLNQGFLAESHLAGTPPERDVERQILGQQALSRRKTEEKRS